MRGARTYEHSPRPLGPQDMQGAPPARRSLV